MKSKRHEPAAAKDLYVSPLFLKARSYAEHVGSAWFILSAEHGLVQPDEWLAPYERYLPETPPSYRAAWGAWVVARLDLLAGPLRGRSVEVHAGAAYVDAVLPHLASLGAEVSTPLGGLTMGERLHWYNRAARPAAEQFPRPDSDDERAEPAMRSRHDPSQRRSVDEVIDLLRDGSRTISPADLLASGRQSLRAPGLYSWWVDDAGADELYEGLERTVRAGLIYAGLAGATRWPSGQRSQNTLWARLEGMHLGGNHRFSTFRLTLGSIHAARTGAAEIDEAELTRWMYAHLRVIAVPWPDADSLGQLERQVLEALDPPLNLQGMAPSDVRRRLTILRRRHGTR